VSEDEACVAGEESVTAHAKPGKAQQKLEINAKKATPVPYTLFLFLRMKLITFYPPRARSKKKPRTSCPSSDGL